MKIDRLMGILAILLQKDTVTAPYLAEQFEVSKRTINRDVEALCKAGIPVVTRRGTGGGISIMENYKIDRTVFSTEEMRDIVAGLRSLDSVHGTRRYRQLMEKLSAGSSDLLEGNSSILIDLSSWYKESLSPKIELIRKAIDERREMEFFYYSPREESIRRIEPYYLVFRWSSWYVWGWCLSRQDFRLFKLNRMEELHMREESFQRKAAFPELQNEKIFPGGIRVKALFEAGCKWRLVEEFGRNCFEEQKDGKLLFQADYTDKESLISWILTFRDQVTLLEPESIRQEIGETIAKMAAIYDTK